MKKAIYDFCAPVPYRKINTIRIMDRKYRCITFKMRIQHYLCVPNTSSNNDSNIGVAAAGAVVLAAAVNQNQH